MGSRKQWWSGLICVLGISVLILDSKTAFQGALEGLEICLRTVIPALFPFLFLCIFLTPILSGAKIKFLRPMGKLCGIPAGAEQLLLLGFLGGYPIGAQAISSAWKGGSLTKISAHRMLGFCSNAGPSFLFGMGAALFSKSSVAWVLWLIHIISALITGALIPRKQEADFNISITQPITLVLALERSIKAMANICGWVLLFRVLLTFLERWCFWLFHDNIRILLIGLIELSNGCIEIGSIYAEGGRFVWMSVILGFGGICVLAQTLSATKDLGIGFYFPGKLLQSCLSFLLAYGIQFYLFPARHHFFISAGYIAIVCSLAISLILFMYRKKIVAILSQIIYNKKKSSHKENFYVIS